MDDLKYLSFISLKDLATIYSGVTLAVLGVIGYFIKRYYDLKSKKVEIRHSLFQQNKITAITYYLSSYIHIDKLVHKMIVDDEILVPIQLEHDLVSATENFKISLMQLNLYLLPDEMKNYQTLYLNIEGIWIHIERLKSSQDTGEYRDNSDVLMNYLRNIILDNATVVESIGYSTRKMFYS